jgi:hypothetical protein
MRPARISARARATLTALQALLAWRGVKRCVKLSASSPCRTPSIQPKHSASSSACVYPMPRSSA